MNLLSLFGRGLKLAIGFSLAGSAAHNARISIRTFRTMVRRGRFEVVDSYSLDHPQDGLRMAGHGAIAATEGYLAWRLISDAVR